MPMSPIEFAQTIKSKYPSYANVEDNLLVKKVLEKYPTYRSQVDFNKKDEAISLKETAKNIIPSGISTIKHLKEGVVGGIEALGQTGANIAVGGPGYALKKAGETAKGLAVGAGTAIGQGAANLVYNPVQARKDIGKFLEKNPTEIAVGVLTSIPGGSELLATKTAKLLENASTKLGYKHLALKVPTGKGVSALRKQAIKKEGIEIAKTMLKENVIDPLGRIDKTLENLNVVVSDSGRGLATIREGLQESGVPALNPRLLKEKVTKALTKEVMTDEEKNALNKTLSLIDQVGDSPIGFKKSQALTSSLQQGGAYVHGIPTSDAAVKSAYSRAGGIASDLMDEAVARAAKISGKENLLGEYEKYKSLYGMSKGAQEALAVKVARESNNRSLSLTSYALGAGGLAHGGLSTHGGLEAAGAALGAEVLRRYGTGAGATALKYGSKGVKELGKIGVPKGYLKYKGPGAKQIMSDIKQVSGNERGNILLGKGGDEITIYRGKNTAQTGNNYYSTDKEFARNFTQSGKDSEIIKDTINKSDVYVKNPIPRATDAKSVDMAIKEAESKGLKAVAFNEGEGQPMSIFKIQDKGSSLESQALKYKSAEEFVRAQFGKKPEYGMSHRPTYEDMPPAHNLLEGGIIPKDVYEHPEWSIASGRNVKTDISARESWDVLKKIRDNPNADVTVYRAGRENKLNNGDWITFSKNYAEQSLEGNIEKVRSFKIKAKDAIFAGDDINEFGYYPKSSLTALWNKAHGKLEYTGKK